MGLHMVALVKLHLQVTSHGLRPAVVGLACPLLLKLLMGFRIFRDDALYQSRLFLFQLGQIAFNTEAQLSNVARMERALDFIWRTLTPSPTTSPSEDSQLAQQSLHDLSMLAL
ncbi:hypothetical protein CR513_22888, partial [Mucuna pruriens]